MAGNQQQPQNSHLFYWMTGALVLLFGSGLLFLLGWFMAHRAQSATPYGSPKTHWSVVRESLAYDSGKTSHLGQPETDLNGSLNALVAMGEIEYEDFVLPTVYWNERTLEAFSQYHRTTKGIVWIESDQVYRSFEISGKLPVHIRVWYRDGSQNEVQGLIDALENAAKVN